VACLVIFVLLVADLVYSSVRFENALSRASSLLQEGADAFKRERIDLAHRHFVAALKEADAAEAATGRPGFVVASVLPWASTEVDAARGLAEAAAFAARVGRTAVEGRRAMGAGTQDIGQILYADGRVQIDAIERGLPFLNQVQDLIEQGVHLLEGLDRPHTGRLKELVGLISTRFEDAHQQVERGEMLLNLVADLFGRGGPRRYLLLFQTQSEARGTGGLAGLYGVIEARDGRVRLAEVGPFGELTGPPLENAPVTDWFRKRYWDDLRHDTWALQWQRANFSPHFPEAAELFIRLYESSREKRLNGAIALDALGLAEFTKVTGPLRVPGVPIEIDHANAARVLLRDSYIAFDDPANQSRFLAALTRRFWARLRQGNIDPGALVAEVSRAISAQHIKIYARDPDDESALATFQADGGLPLAPVAQSVWNNNLAMNKVDFFLQRSVDTAVRLSADGGARVSTSALLENRAPSGPPSVLLGTTTLAPPGHNLMQLNFLLPQSARLQDLRIDGRSVAPETGFEGPFPVVWHDLDIPPGEEQRVDIVYRVPHAFSPTSSEPVFELTLAPQESARPDRISLIVDPPSGFDVVDAERRSTPMDSLRIDGVLTRDQRIRIMLVRQGAGL
jgi:hypothetical protein